MGVMNNLNKYKNLITGQTVKKAEGALDKATARMTNPANGGRSTLNQAAHMSRLSDAADKAKSATTKARVGTGAAVGTGALGVGGYEANKREKTASDVINESFEKIASTQEKIASDIVNEAFEKIAKATIIENEEKNRGLKAPVPKATITKKEEEERGKKNRDLTHGAGVISTKRGLGQKTAMDIINDVITKM